MVHSHVSLIAATMSPHPAALSYSEPEALTILVLASFVLLLNVINWLLDRIVYCGLIGQILVGIAYGVPGTDWLSRAMQDSVMQLGYLGLILIVYEGTEPQSAEKCECVPC